MTISIRPISRRCYLQASALALPGIRSVFADDPAPAPPVLDTHTHFYDPTRKEGVPWPAKDDKLLFRRVLPEHFLKLAGPHGVTATVVVEASPWVEDNQWLLDLAAKERSILGIVGNLDPLGEGFAKHLVRFAKNPLYRGIRISHDTLQKGLGQDRFAAAMKLLIDQNLELDVNGGPAMPADVARLAQRFPNLRIVINHAANLRIDGKAPPKEWQRDMQAAARGRNVYCKVSALVEGAGRADGKAPADAAFYRPVLDALWDNFGEDRLVFGSNWPVSERYGSYAVVVRIAREYFQGRGARAARKFLWDNAVRAYRLSDRKR